MSPSDYTEELLVEQPAVDLFGELAWQTLSASDEVFGAAGTLGRETKSEVVLIPKLRAALERLNPTLPADAINSAVIASMVTSKAANSGQFKTGHLTGSV